MSIFKEKRLAVSRLLVSVECSRTTFEGPIYSDDTDTPSFICLRDVSQEPQTPDYVEAHLTFNGVASPMTLTSFAHDVVEFHFTADHIRGQFGRWVSVGAPCTDVFPLLL